MNGRNGNGDAPDPGEPGGEHERVAHTSTRLLAADDVSLVKFGDVQRRARKLKPGEEIVEIPSRNADDPKQNRTRRHRFVAEIGTSSRWYLDQLQLQSRRFCEEPIIGSIAVNMDGGGFAAGGIEHQRCSFIGIV